MNSHRLLFYMLARPWQCLSEYIFPCSTDCSELPPLWPLFF